MRNKAPSLIPLLRSERMAAALATLYLHPTREYSLTDLAEAIDTTPSTLHRDVGYLTESGFVDERTDGRSRKLSARIDHPLAAPMRSLVLATYGPPAVLCEEFGGVAGVEQLLIYGSWAARYMGEPGAFPNDIDVVVVGSARRSDAHEAAITASARLGIEVNVTAVTTQRWKNIEDPLVSNIRSRPLVPLEFEPTSRSRQRDIAARPITA